MAVERHETSWVENWYELHELPNEVLAIGEPRHQEEVFCYLVKGRDKDLLIDTGMGVIPLTRVLERRRNSIKPLIVVNTHSHYDHVGGDKYFDEVLVPKNMQEVAGFLEGWTTDTLQKLGFFNGFKKNGESTVPVNFDLDNFCIAPITNTVPKLHDGFTIDLGDRLIEVIDAPGHTPGSVCFFDQTHGLLFTGDLLYEGPLYAFDILASRKESDPDSYLNSLKRINKRLNGKIAMIHPGHNYPESIYEPRLLDEAIKLFRMAKQKKTPDGNSTEFPDAVKYVQPGESLRPESYGSPRRLEVLVNKDYLKSTWF